MLTRCPNCQTIFRIREDQLKMADGLAHCYRCEQVFNAREHLSEIPAMTRAEVRAAPSPATEAGDTGGALPSAQVESAIADIQKGIDPAPLAQNGNNGAPAPPPPPLSLDELLAPPKKRRSLLATLFWLLACTTLLAAAALQLAWFEREQVIQYPEGRRLLEKLCDHVPCQVPERRDLSLIQITQRQIRSHPQRRNALLVELTLENRAPFHQPYPTVELSLSTIDGQLVARRSFSPAEYLGPTADPQMPPGIPRQIRIEIEDPGSNVTGFEFNFF